MVAPPAVGRVAVVRCCNATSDATTVGLGVVAGNRGVFNADPCKAFVRSRFPRPLAVRLGTLGVPRFAHHEKLSQFLAVRFSPIAPFNLVNFLLGFTSIHWLPYSLGTWV